MSPIFFWIASALMLIFGAAVIINRNPVASALSLVVSFLGLGGALHVARRLFHRHHSGAGLRRRGHGAVPLHHHAARSAGGGTAPDQLRRLRRRRRRWRSFFSGSFISSSDNSGTAKLPFPALLGDARVDDVHSIGLFLFGNYNLPFQIIGVLFVVATIGVIVLSKRELR